MRRASRRSQMRLVITAALTCAVFVSSAKAVRELVIIKEPQPAQRVEGIVLDPSGAPVPEVVVTDRTQDGVTVLRSTGTDRKGHFQFSKQGGKTMYCLRFDHPMLNPLQLTLKLDKHAPQRGITAKPEIGG